MKAAMRFSSSAMRIDATGGPFVEGYGDLEDRAAARRVRDAHRSAVGAGDDLNDVESEPAARLLRRPAREAFEDALLVGVGDARSVIAHPQVQLAGVAVAADHESAAAVRHGVLGELQ